MEKKIDFAVGGQALIEGVMIRSPNFVSIAVRKPNGEIILKHQKYISLAKRIKLFGLPVIRGMVTLIETMALGMNALNFSAEHALEEDKTDGEEPQQKSHTNESQAEKSGETNEVGKSVKKAAGASEQKPTSRVWGAISFTLSLIFSVALAIFLFKFVPLFLTEQLRKIWPALQNSTLLFNIIDGLIRITIFFSYIFLLAQFKSFKRVFQYHGAEHKSIFAYEKGSALTPEYVKPESPRHPRCGTSFIIIVLIVSILLLSFVPRHPVFWISFLRRLAIVPLIMGVGYEVLKWTAKFAAQPPANARHTTLMLHTIVKSLTYPGIFTQYITTKEPDEKQIEVALAALKKALELEKNPRV